MYTRLAGPVSLLIVAIVVEVSFAGDTSEVSFTSPDGQLRVDFNLRQDGPNAHFPTYAVQWEGKTLIAPSRLQLSFQQDSLRGPLRVVDVESTSKDDTWTQPFGERSEVRDNYQGGNILLEEVEAPHRRMRLEFRAYNEGLAFRYAIPAQPALSQFTVENEHTEFVFTGDHTTWVTDTSQGPYSKSTLSRMGRGRERPLTINVSPECYVAIGEARQVDYSRMRLGAVKGSDYAVVSQIEGPVVGTTPFVTPWRVVLLGHSPGELLEHNDIFLNLNDPCELDDISWIKPGKVIRDVSLTTEGGKACVDFAVKHNLQYVIESAGWYGNEFTTEADATTVTLDPKRSKGALGHT